MKDFGYIQGTKDKMISVNGIHQQHSKIVNTCGDFETKSKELTKMLDLQIQTRMD
jgi:hypothetical protein